MCVYMYTIFIFFAHQGDLALDLDRRQGRGLNGNYKHIYIYI